MVAGDAPVVRVGSMIKSLGCVGLRVGWLIGDDDLLRACRDLKDYTTHIVCPVSEKLATWVLQTRRTTGARYRGWLRENLARFQSVAARHPERLDWIPPEGGVVSFPFVHLPDGSTERFARTLVERAEVFVLPGESFEMPGYVRLGFGIAPGEFAQAMERLETFFSERLC